VGEDTDYRFPDSGEARAAVFTIAGVWDSALLPFHIEHKPILQSRVQERAGVDSRISNLPFSSFALEIFLCLDLKLKDGEFAGKRIHGIRTEFGGEEERDGGGDAGVDEEGLGGEGGGAEGGDESVLVGEGGGEGGEGGVVYWFDSHRRGEGIG